MKLWISLLCSLLFGIAHLSGCNAASLDVKPPKDSAFPIEIKVIEATGESAEKAHSGQEGEDSRADALYGALSPEEEKAALQAAMEHTLGCFKAIKEVIRGNYSEKDLRAALDPPLQWGDFDASGTGWMFYVEKYGLKDHPDRTAFVSISITTDNEPVMEGYYVHLVKPLDTDTWTVVNYGF